MFWMRLRRLRPKHMPAMLTEIRQLGGKSMSAAPGPHRFDDVRVILAPNGTATTKAITPNFYAELDGEFNNFEGHILVMAHNFSEDWGMWEMHPMGDEIVGLREGDVDFVLWRDGAEGRSQHSGAGAAKSSCRKASGTPHGRIKNPA